MTTTDGIMALMDAAILSSGALASGVVLFGSNSELTEDRANAANVACTALKAAIEALAKDAARWKVVKPLFRAMSLDMGGNHTWTLSNFGMLKGPSMDEAADRLIEAAQANQHGS